MCLARVYFVLIDWLLAASRIREQEQELAQLRLELLRKQQQHDALMAQQQQQQQLQRMQIPQKSMVGRSNALGEYQSFNGMPSNLQSIWLCSFL